jgi:hypothetical protein
MTIWEGYLSAGRTLAAGAAVIVAMSGVGVAPGHAASDCQTVEELMENFLSVYPTGGHAARFDGASGDRVMEGLAISGDGDEVVFLYSGDGPTTGARGRYMYVILDPADCVTDSSWVDGETFDRVSP